MLFEVFYKRTVGSGKKKRTIHSTVPVRAMGEAHCRKVFEQHKRGLRYKILSIIEK